MASLEQATKSSKGVKNMTMNKQTAKQTRQEIRQLAKKMTMEEKQAFILRHYENLKVTDCGKEGKAFEPAVSLYLSRQATALYVKPQGQTDKVWQVNNVAYNIEAKTAAGKGLVKAERVTELLNEGASLEDIVENTYPNANFIVYAPEYNPYAPVEYQAFAFTRNEFIDMLNGYTANICRIHPNGELAINTFSSSKKKTAYIWDKCLDQPNLETFKKTIMA